MLELTSETFHPEAKKKKVLLCIFYHALVDDLPEILLRIFSNSHQLVAATIGHVNVEKYPEIPRMFGIGDDEPTVILMREQVVLFCEPISTLLEKYDIFSISKQIADLDMKRVRHEIEVEKQSRAHLYGRRVCPTAKRTGGV